MVALFTGRKFSTDYIPSPVLFKILFKIMQNLLDKKDMSQTVCVYFFHFTWGHKKLILNSGTIKKANEAWGL